MGFFGGVTASDNPNLYVSQLQYVYGYYSNMKRPAPLVINTMGWVEGTGIHDLHTFTVYTQICSPMAFSSVSEGRKEMFYLMTHSTHFYMVTWCSIYGKGPFR